VQTYGAWNRLLYLFGAERGNLIGIREINESFRTKAKYQNKESKENRFYNRTVSQF
jgi:hypothetical protein